MSGIRLHPTKGLNPVMGKCFWCGGDSGEILLLGIKGGDNPPRHMVANYDPCAQCKSQRALGITLIAVQESALSRANSREIAPGMVPTGGFAIVSESWVRDNVEPERLRDNMLLKRMAFCPPELVEMLTKRKAELDSQQEQES